MCQKYDIFITKKQNGSISMKKKNEISDNFLDLIKIAEKLRDKEDSQIFFRGSRGSFRGN